MTIKEVGIEDFIRRYIRIYSSVALPKDKVPTDREEDFLVQCVLFNSEGIDIGTKEAVKRLNKSLRLSRNNVYVLRSMLRDKGWLVQTVEGLKLHPTIDFRDMPIPRKFNFKFALEYNEGENRQTD